jgi:hypothetical protein
MTPSVVINFLSSIAVNVSHSDDVWSGCWQVKFSALCIVCMHVHVLVLML